MKAFCFSTVLIWTKLSKSSFVQGWIPRNLLLESQHRTTALLYVPRGGSHNGDSDEIDSRTNHDRNPESSNIPMQEERHQSNEYCISHENEESNGYNRSDEEQIDDKHSARILENVEIIPFDSDSGEDVGEDSGENPDVFVEQLPDNVCNEISDESVSNDVELDFLTDTLKDENENGTRSGSTSSWTQSRHTKIRHGENSSSLKERIVHLIRQMEQHDIQRFEDAIQEENCICKQMYRRAYEYVEELEIFEQDYRHSLSENKNLPSLEKAAPHPKSFLHYIAPKIQAIRLSPEVMLKIRNAEIDDVRNAVNAIAILGCLVDLYITVLRRLDPCDADDTVDSEGVKRVIREDRRFQQLMECASCGININHWLQTYEDMTTQLDLSVDPNNKYAGEQRAIQKSNSDEEFYEQLTECPDLSFCFRWMMGLLSLGINHQVSVNSYSGKEIAAALVMKSYDIFHSEQFIKRLIDEQTRISCLDEVFDAIRIVSLSKDTFQIDLDFVLCYCVDLLWKDINAIKGRRKEMYSELQEDEVINRLSISEENGTEETNETSTGRNITVIHHDDVLSEEVEGRLVDFLSTEKCYKLLKAVLRNPCQRILSSPTMIALVDKVTTEFHNEVNNFLEVQKRHSDRHDSISSPIHGNFTVSYLSRNKMGYFLFSGQPVLSYDSKIIVTCLENITRTHAMVSSLDALGIVLSDFNIGCFNTQLGRYYDGNAHEMVLSGFSIDPNYSVGVKIKHHAWNNYLYECSVIMHAVSMLGHRFEKSIVESCLSLSEELGTVSLSEMEDADILNLICGVSSICSTVRLSKPSANRLATLLKTALKKDYKFFRLRDVTHLLEAIATIISTQSSPIIHQIAEEESLYKLIEHGVSLIRSMTSAPTTDLIILAWVHSEYKKFHTISSWGNFELLGQCVAAVSSTVLHDSISDNNDHDQCSANKIGCDALCKLAFALSLNGLEVHELCRNALQYLRQDWETFRRIHILDKIRFLFSLAKSIKNEYALDTEFAKDIDAIITMIEEETDFECLSPYYYALAVWSMGRLRGEKVSSLWHNIPSYTHEDISMLSPETVLRLLHGIVSIISEQEMQSNLKAQLLTIRLLSQIDDKMKLMSPKQLCVGVTMLSKLREYCLSDELVDQRVNICDRFDVDQSNEVFNDDNYDLKNEAEELVIGSLFPGSNIREIFQLCDNILLRLLNHVRAIISSFSAREMKVMLNISRHMQHKKLLVAIKNEIDSRVDLVRKCLSLKDHGPIEDAHQNEDDVKESTGTYTSKIRRLFSSTPQLETNENESESRNKDDLTENINILRGTLNDMSSNDFLLKTALEAAYDLGICTWQMRGIQKKCETDHPPLSYLYL